MRRRFSDAIVSRASDPVTVFLTGDLGYKALEPVRDALGARFINAGVSEQNMISVAAGLAKTGLRPFAYSIAPFLYARPFEQIRNDICLHGLPVCLVGNGGGYGYGVMGATHHALEDYGVLLTLGGMTVIVPAFGTDVASAVGYAGALAGPSYLRLGLAEDPTDGAVPDFAAWRCVLVGQGPVIVVCGSVVGPLLGAYLNRPVTHRPSIWVVGILPLGTLPVALLEDIDRAGHLVVVEEHVAHGGVGQMLAIALFALGVRPTRFDHRHAIGYPSGRYGSQGWHRRECGLDVASVSALIDGAPMDEAARGVHR